ncbi:hypothetical protein P5F73_17060 [Clostridium perfringens]|nr:hypothetical protein [Clostridium perfringens]
MVPGPFLTFRNDCTFITSPVAVYDISADELLPSEDVLPPFPEFPLSTDPPLGLFFRIFIIALNVFPI